MNILFLWKEEQFLLDNPIKGVLNIVKIIGNGSTNLGTS